MNTSLKDQLQHAEARLYHNLFAPIALSNLYELAKKLPPVRGAVLECRLEANEPRVDLSICLPNDFTIGQFDKSTLLQFKLGKYQKIFNNFSRSRSTTLNQGIRNIYELVENIWLEFDVLGDTSSIPLPAIGLHLNQTDNLSASIFRQQLPCFSHKEIINQLVTDLLEQEYSTNFQVNLQRCIEVLPVGAKIIFLGAASSRQTNAVRFIINKILPSEISTYLANAGWTGNFDELRTQILALSNLVDNIVLSFNIGDIISPQIGLECYLIVKEWQNFIEYLVINGACTPTKGKALLAWTGFAEEASQYIDNIEEGTSLYKEFQNLVRFDFSVKITFHSGKPLSAKGYLGLWNNIGSIQILQ